MQVRVRDGRGAEGSRQAVVESCFYDIVSMIVHLYLCLCFMTAPNMEENTAGIFCYVTDVTRGQVGSQQAGYESWLL